MAYLKKVKSGYYKNRSYRKNGMILGKASILDFQEKNITFKEKVDWFIIKLLYKMRLVR